MIDRKTYLTLPGDYKTLKSDFLGTLEASGKDVLVLTDCVTLKVGKTRFIISPLFAPIDPKRIVSKAFTKEEFTALMTEYHEGCTPEDIESLRFVPHIVHHHLDVLFNKQRRLVPTGHIAKAVVLHHPGGSLVLL